MLWFYWMKRKYRFFANSTGNRMCFVPYLIWIKTLGDVVYCHYKFRFIAILSLLDFGDLFWILDMSSHMSSFMPPLQLRLTSPTTVCSARSRRHNRLSAYDGRPRHRRLPYRLFLAAPTAKCCSDADVRGGGFFVNAFISCRLDYCNALLYGIADGQLQRLQSVQNAAARLVTGTRRTDHITPVLQSLHWLPVRQRDTFKLATLIHYNLRWY